MMFVSVFITVLLVASGEPSLCGIDSYSGRDYSHRKAWILDRLRHCAGFFCVEIGGYAITSKQKYNMLLDWTGRESRRDKRGAIPDELAPILDRLGVGRSDCERARRCFGLMGYSSHSVEQSRNRISRFAKKQFNEYSTVMI